MRAGVTVQRQGACDDLQKYHAKLILFCMCCLAVGFMSGCRHMPARRPSLEWVMINVNQTGQQADAHLIRVRDGKTILIDAGHRNTAESMLLPFLRREGITTIDSVFITHPHIDHYGGLEYILRSGINVGEIFFNLPDKEVCDREIPWGCNYQDVLTVRKLYSSYGVELKKASAGMKFTLGDATTLEILYAFDGVHTPVGKTDVNDLSLVMMLRHQGIRCLYTGDLNKKIGTYVAQFPKRIAADVLKVPHHGTESTVPDAFFQSVSPRYGLVPAPASLWQSQRSRRIREWFSLHQVPVFVNGLDGDIRVTVNRSHLHIEKEGRKLKSSPSR